MIRKEIFDIEYGMQQNREFSNGTNVIQRPFTQAYLRPGLYVLRICI
jgi:hypothetical protein